jgi:heme-degrading monooxygenase HmoA
MQTALEQAHEISPRSEFPLAGSESQSIRSAIRAASNIRAVGFIAKPESVHDLTTTVKGQLIKLLRQAPGFDGAMLLHSHKEWRNVTLLTFWETEAQALHTDWEDFQAVRKLISPLVDMCTKVQTFQGTLPEMTSRSTVGH